MWFFHTAGGQSRPDRYAFMVRSKSGRCFLNIRLRDSGELDLNPVK